MSTLTVTEPNCRKFIPIFKMKSGEFGITENGLIYYRTLETAACLNIPNMTYSSVDPLSDAMVYVLPPGTKIEIVI